MDTKQTHTLNAYYRVLIFFVIGAVTIGITAYVYTQKLNTPLEDFPRDGDVLVEEGGTIRSVAVGLADAHVVRSAFYLYLVLTFMYPDEYVQAGMYRFPTALTTKEVASSIISGNHQSPLLRVTFPEGFRARDFYTYFTLNNTLPTSTLIEHEGYLFPDTYFVVKDANADDVRKVMEQTFHKRIEPYTTRISASGFSKHEVVILASIIEREAKDAESRRMVAGVLLNRLRDNMPLQVDATLDYILDKESSELTLADLKIESPFNTYTRRGLPPAPIANPGIDAIEAVLSPTESEFYYYLTAPDGTFYYAKTFEEHKLNKATYLK